MQAINDAFPATDFDPAAPVDCSIIIPTRDQLDFLKPCVDSILANDSKTSFEILIVDNQSEERISRSYLEAIQGDLRVRVIRWHKPFNFSELNNAAARQARGAVLCFLNNDTRVITPHWLDRLVPLAARKDVGAVGALLLYADHTIQHGGIALDQDWVARHVAHREAGDYFANHTPNTVFDVDAVSAACMFTRRDLFLSCGGFDARSLPVSFNDVDYCLQLRDLGYPILVDPGTRLFHYESVSRKSDDLPGNQPRALAEKRFMLRKWSRRLKDRHYAEGIPATTLFLSVDDDSGSDGAALEHLIREVSRREQSTLAGMDAIDDASFSHAPGATESGDIEQKYKNLQLEFLALQERYRETELALRRIVTSRYWKVTAPIRVVFRWILQLRQWCGRSLMGYPLGRWLIALKNGAPTARRDLGEVSPDQVKALHDQAAEQELAGFLASGGELVFPDRANPAVSILLVLYNKAPLTYLCLRSIIRHAGEDYELVVVDNASSDASGQLLARLRNAVVLRNAENTGFVRAVNQAAAVARGRHILLLNNDALLEAGSLQAAMETLEESPAVGAVGARIKLLDGSLQEAGSIIWRDGSCLGYGRSAAPDDPEFMFRRPVDYCSGAFLLLDGALFRQLGGFDEAFAPAYYEESDFCIRLWQEGKSVVYEPRAQISHYEFASSGGFEGASRLQAEHRLILCRKHAAYLDGKQDPSPANILQARTCNDFPNVLVIDDRVPHRHLGAGYPRCAEILAELGQFPFNVTFYPLQISFDEWAQVYRTLPRNMEVMLYRGRDGLQEFLESRKGFYEFILVSRVHNMEFFGQLASRRPDLVAGARVIYDAEAVTAPREAMRLQLRGERVTESRQRQMIEHEMALAKDAYKIVTVSEAETELYASHGFGNSVVLGHKVVPAPTRRTFADREGLLFVGALRDPNSPNIDSLFWFVHQVLPLLNDQLGRPVPLFVVGENTAPNLRGLHSDQVKFLGRLDELSDIYDHCRVFVAPTRFAAGIPHKVHESAAFGLPCVVTPLLAKQLGWEHGRQLLSGGTAEEFAAACSRLYQDGALWQQLRQAAMERIVEDCSPAKFRATLREIFS